jgi:hypothetical protein
MDALAATDSMPLRCSSSACRVVVALYAEARKQMKIAPAALDIFHPLLDQLQPLPVPHSREFPLSALAAPSEVLVMADHSANQMFADNEMFA